MRKKEFIEKYGEEKYQEYLLKQKLLAKKWRENNLEKSRDSALKRYYRNKNKTPPKKRKHLEKTDYSVIGWWLKKEED